MKVGKSEYYVYSYKGKLNETPLPFVRGVSDSHKIEDFALCLNTEL
ncbi:hypothetical protein [Clostridium thailandense]